MAGGGGRGPNLPVVPQAGGGARARPRSFTKPLFSGDVSHRAPPLAAIYWGAIRNIRGDRNGRWREEGAGPAVVACGGHLLLFLGLSAGKLGLGPKHRRLGGADGAAGVGFGIFL